MQLRHTFIRGVSLSQRRLQTVAAPVEGPVQTDAALDTRLEEEDEDEDEEEQEERVNIFILILFHILNFHVKWFLNVLSVFVI